MLKGQLQIELKDIHTGATERYEQHNLVTDALASIIPTLAGGGTDNNYSAVNMMLMPLGKRGLGGLMLFDGPLTDQADNIHFPSEAHLVAYAGQVSNTSYSDRGSINFLESGKTDTGYVNVWDFDTSQANGVIQSLALTHANEEGYTYPYRFRATNKNGESYSHLHDIETEAGDSSSTVVALMFDEEEQTLYYIKALSTTSSNHRAAIYALYLPTTKYRVADSYNLRDYTHTRQICEFEYDYSVNTSAYLQWRNGYDGYAYMAWTNGGNSTGNGTLKYRRMKLSDKSFEISDILSVTCPSCQLYNQFCNVNNGFAYIKAYDLSGLYVVELANPANIQKAEVPEGYQVDSNALLSGLHNGGVKFEVREREAVGSYYNYHDAICYPDGYIAVDQYYTGISTQYTTSHLSYDRYPFILLTDHLMTYGGMGSNSYYCHGYLTNNYLGTICNLETPVHKTPSQSMKITYTLTDGA